MGVREEKKEQTRIALLQTGLQLFMEQSFARTTVDQITASAKVGKGTFYNYFATKEDLLVAAMQFTQDRDAEALREVVYQLPATAERLKRVISRSIECMIPFPELVMVWCLERLRRGANPTASGFDLLLTSVIAAGQESGELRKDRTAEQMTIELEGIFLSYTAAWYHSGLVLDLTRLMDDAIDAYLVGNQSRNLKEDLS